MDTGDLIDHFTIVCVNIDELTHARPCVGNFHLKGQVVPARYALEKTSPEYN